MDALTYDLVTLCKWRNEGSFATRANRVSMLKQMAQELKQAGYHLPSARSIKPKHVEFLIETWQGQGLNPRTIKNRLGVLRWWADAVNKRSIMHRSNEGYGIDSPEKGERPDAIDLQSIDVRRVECPLVRASLELEALFGLRREEAIKVRPASAVQGDVLVLKSSWTKGGRPRSVPIISDDQRLLLGKIVAMVGANSLIPEDIQYVQHLGRYHYQLRKAGISHAHRLRHGYAQRRYREMTGWEPPAKGGPTPTTPEQVRIDREARLELSRELGHNRISITKVYLG
ncbi:MAG: phage integrase N-terminal domain-containing protein [Hyphomicrobiaceae bacterium]